MCLSLLRRLTACIAVVAAVTLAPARSEAGIQILVEELDASSNVVGTGSFFTGTPSGGGVFAQSFTYSGTQLSILSGSALTNSHLGTAPASLSTNFGIAVLLDNPTNTLRITVTDDGYTAGAGLPAILRNTSSVSIATDAAAQVDSFSTVLSTPLTVPTSSTTNVATGTVVGGPTDVATDVRPDTLGISPVTTALVSSLPNQYALQQQIIISIPPGVNTPANTSFNGTAGVTATPVPAPGGVALALVGLPLLGLRRILRKRAETV